MYSIAQVNTWNTNYRRAVGCGGGQSLFDTMLHGRKPFGNARRELIVFSCIRKSLQSNLSDPTPLYSNNIIILSNPTIT